MKRISLDERLKGLPPGEEGEAILMEDMRVGAYVRTLMAFCLPLEGETYRKLRALDDGTGEALPLCTALWKVWKGDKEAMDGIFYDVLVKPFTDMIEREDEHE